MVKDILKKYWYWLLFSVVFWSIAVMHVPKEFVDLGGDSAQYIILAESLVHGTGYHAVNVPGNPFFYHYPPVFPLLLVIVVYFFGRSFFLMHLLVALCAYLALFVCYCLFREGYTRRLAFASMILTALSAPFLASSLWYILSEMPFLLFSSLALFFIRRYAAASNVFSRDGFLAVIFLNISYFTRYAALALIAAVLLFLVFSRKNTGWKKAIFAALMVLIPIAVWQFICHWLNPGSVNTYLQQLKPVTVNPVVKFFQGLIYYCSTVNAVMFSSIKLMLGAAGRTFFVVVFALFAIVGMARHFRQDRNSVVLYFVFLYMCLIALWPFGTGDMRETMRFILPIVPFVIFFAVLGFDWMLQRYCHKQYWFYAALTCGIILTAFFLALPVQRISSKNISKTSADFIEANLWIGKNIPGSGVVLSRKPSLTYFYSGHQALNFPYSEDSEKIWEFIFRNNISYIIADDVYFETKDYLVPAILKYRRYTRLIYSYFGTAVFKVVNNPLE